MIRRLGGSPAPPEVGVEVLLERAVTADLYMAGTEQGGLRAAVAAASLDGVSAAALGNGLAAGFAASAHSDEQLAVARAWLSDDPPDGLAVDGDLRGALLQTLAARGLASDDDLDSLIAADPVGGERNRATCRALRPDAAAKAAAWEMALAKGQDWRMALASARGLWVPGGAMSTTGIASGTSPRRWRRSTAGRSRSCGTWPGRCTRRRSPRTRRWRRPRPRWSTAR